MMPSSSQQRAPRKHLLKPYKPSALQAFTSTNMSSSMSSTPRVSTVFGNWCRASSTSTDVDLEAQIITGSHAPFMLPSTPEAAQAAASPTRTPEQPTATDPIDDFFGVTRATRESRHDSLPASSTEDLPPPPYADASLPAYSVAPNTEPVTLAMYLFRFGFLFPPFWILGAIILLSPLTAPADFEPSKSEDERQQLVHTMRETEVKWAKRCAIALLAFFVLLGLIAGIAVVVMHS
ncbi:hypothetical protein PAXRUDRAFT_835342 [Paxillus rubicundulus Ve08.2h10]|uniref:Uncharacterized protein n=1 Tax=Paxillus rubicundulus Ve08.2h10 TaxID=930991 RepID=A0A0D0CML7_9AGAM|nr:hypothetical protein PAXRUDRAFT_835342 [Paxillus rubicundulus Ve08.2h10]